MSTGNLLGGGAGGINSNSAANERIFDYFIISGLPPKLTARKRLNKAAAAAASKKTQQHLTPEAAAAAVEGQQQLKQDNVDLEHDESLLYRNDELDASKSLDKLDPIVELAVLNKSLNESVPHGFEAIWQTPAGFSANLCNDSMFKQSEVFLLFRRGTDRPPITDIGIYYEGSKEQVMPGCVVIRKTVGDASANLNTSTFNAEQVFVTYRRTHDLACNSLAVTDICVILKSKVIDHSPI
jgi:hypothetical protein